MDQSKLDLAFVVDTTGSMGSYIQHAKNNIKKIADELRLSDKCDLKIGIVNYRDHPPQDTTYLTQIYHLTNSIIKTKIFINRTQASGGGDIPEAVCCGLNDCLNALKWRDDAVKVVILISDAPPHGLGSDYDGFPDGCPNKNDPVEIAHEMAARGITLYTAGCEPYITPYRKFFIALSLITGGQYVPLNNSARLTEMIVGGAREDISMEKLMAQVHEEYFKEVAENRGRVDEDELTKRIHKVLNSSGEAKVNSLMNFETIEITDETKELCKQTCLKGMVYYSKRNNIGLVPSTSILSRFRGLIGPVLKKTYGIFYSAFYSVPVVDKKRKGEDDSDEECGGAKKRLRSESSVGRTTTTIIIKEDVKKEEANVEEADTETTKTYETVDIDHARRLVKKVIARNK